MELLLQAYSFLRSYWKQILHHQIDLTPHPLLYLQLGEDIYDGSAYADRLRGVGANLYHVPRRRVTPRRALGRQRVGVVAAGPVATPACLYVVARIAELVGVVAA